MQIILVQTEVEQALRNYVASRLTLAEGTTFSIDLAATRGANGITATIDLVEPGQKPAVPVQQVITKPATKPETAAKPAEAQQATQVAQQAEQAQEQGAGPAAAASESTGETAAQQAQAETAAAPAGEAVSDKPAEGTKSLFGNLNRPKNN